MSASLINRSLTTIRTELDFLRESEVISEETFQQISNSLPQRYDPNANGNRSSSPSLEYFEAIYAFQAQQDGDLNLKPGDKIQVLEKPSSEWYKGKCNGSVGMFPSNYVKPAFSGSNGITREEPARPNLPPPPQYQSSPTVALQPQQTSSSTQLASQPQFPPPSTGFYQQPPQQYYQQPPVQQSPVQQPPVQQPAPEQHAGHNGSQAFKKFGSKLGNAAIFGAGATIGSDIVNSIF